MDANEARKITATAKEAIAKEQEKSEKRKEKYSKEPLNLFQQIRMKLILFRIKRAAQRGEHSITVFPVLNSRIKTKLKETGYGIGNVNQDLVIYW